MGGMVTLNIVKVKEINFLPAEIKETYRKREAVTILIVVVVLSFMSIVGIKLFYKSGLDYFSEQLDSQKKELALNDHVEKKIKLYNNNKADAEMENEVINNIKQEKFSVSSYLKKLLPLLPKKVFINSIKLTEDSIADVDFITSGALDVIELIVKLRDSGYYEGFDFNSLSFSDTTTHIRLKLVPIKKDSK